MATVLLTDPIDPAAQERLTARASVARLSAEGDDALFEAAREADVVIVRRRLPPGLLSGSPRLRAAVRHGAGLDFIDVEEASRAGVAVTNTPAVNAHCVAEHALAGILALRRGLIGLHNGVVAGRWHELRVGAAGRQELRGRTLGVVGFGAVGSAIATLCRAAFAMRVVSLARPGRFLPDWVEPRDLDEVAALADVLVLACPLSDETRGLIDARRLDLMKPGALVVNISRGPVLDEDALAERLADGRLGGAVLDVFQAQPLPGSSPLRALPNVVLTPHVAGVSAGSIAAMSALAVEDTLRILAGERPLHLVNASAWPAIERRLQGLRG